MIALAANKCDLEESRAVSTEEGKAYAHKQAIAYFEISAKMGSAAIRQMFVEFGALACSGVSGDLRRRHRLANLVSQVEAHTP
eukprot:1694585-Prymnesium_polylepis.2